MIDNAQIQRKYYPKIDYCNVVFDALYHMSLVSMETRTLTIRMDVYHCSSCVALVHAIPRLRQQLRLCCRAQCPLLSPYGQLHPLSCARPLVVGSAHAVQCHHVFIGDVQD